ncbi:MAG: PEGA domain-containing protein, partial [Clostridiales bacterium]|nr:PEGA domain-containing protein [Clostridiales bacterium]
ASMPAWSKGLIGAVANAGFMGGYPDGSFKPSNNITRAEAVVTLNNALEGATVEEDTEEVTAVVYDAAGTYGPKDDVEVIEEDVVVTASGVTLTNMTIKGDLTLSEEIGEGEVTLSNVKVEGTTYVYGGGENSIIIKDSALGKVTVDKDNNKVRLLVTGASTVGEVTAKSGVKLEERNLSKDGFTTVVVKASKDNKIILVGAFDTVEVLSADVIVDVPTGTVVDEMVLESAAKVTGKGTIKEATVNADGVKFDKEPVKLTVADDVEEPTIVEKSNNGGGGGSSSGGSSTTTIRITENTGSAAERKTLSGNVIVDAPNVTLTNLVITGNLTISENVGEGNVDVNDVKVNGKTIIAGGGENSIHFTNFVTASITVDKKTGGVRVVVAGDSEVNVFEVQSPVLVDTTGLSPDVNPPGVVLSSAMPEGATVTLGGSFSTVTTSSRDVRISLSAGTSIEELVLNAVAQVLGTSNVTIQRATVSNGASGSRLDTRPTEIVVENNVSIELEGIEYEPGELASTLTLESIVPTMNSIALNFENGARLANGSLSIDDFEVEAKIDGTDYVLQNLAFDNRTDRFIFASIPYDYVGKTFEVTVTSNTDKVVGEETASMTVAQGFGGQIKNIFGFGVPNMTLKFKISETSTNVLAEATTDRFGFYSVNLAPGQYYAELNHTDYIKTYIQVASDSNGYIMNGPDIATLSAQSGEVKIELTWGKEPRDVDSHLLGPAAPGDALNNFHVYYGDKTYGYGINGTYADLDLDDLNSYGPETVTIRRLVDGKYRYFVHNFTGNPDLGSSEAKVKIYQGQGDTTTVLREFVLPLGAGNQRYWAVFDMYVEDGEVTEIVPIEKMSVNQPTLDSTDFVPYGSADQYLLQLEAAKYEAAVTIPNTVEVDEAVEAMLKKLQSGKTADTSITVNTMISETSTYFKNEDGTIRLKSQNTTEADVTEDVTLRFAKGTDIEDKTVTVTIKPQEQPVQKYDVTFNVKDAQGNALNGAEVTVAGHLYGTTDAAGQLKFKVVPGNHAYTVKLDGYQDVTGTVNITNNNETVNVIMIAKQQPVTSDGVTAYVYSAVYNDATNVVTFDINTNTIKNDVFEPLNPKNYFVIVFDDYANLNALKADIASVKYGTDGNMANVTDYVYGTVDGKVYVAVQLGTNFTINEPYKVEVDFNESGKANKVINLKTQQ